MKKVILFAAFGAFGLMSCTKDYTCECTTVDSTGTLDDVVVSSTITGKKADAETACEAGNVNIGPISTACVLK